MSAVSHRLDYVVFSYNNNVAQRNYSAPCGVNYTGINVLYKYKYIHMPYCNECELMLDFDIETTVVSVEGGLDLHSMSITCNIHNLYFISITYDSSLCGIAIGTVGLIR